MEQHSTQHQTKQTENVIQSSHKNKERQRKEKKKNALGKTQAREWEHKVRIKPNEYQRKERKKDSYSNVSCSAIKYFSPTVIKIYFCTNKKKKTKQNQRREHAACIHSLLSFIYSYVRNKFTSLTKPNVRFDSIRCEQ